MQPRTPAMIRLNRVFGFSDETESSWAECLSNAHLGYIVDCVAREEQREQAVIDEFLASKD